ncbi:lysylphosphatidylglycerol synthase domain-containing protein [Kineococcus esterisolvens]|uniref:lysylphosphatidylglycerol synthase domain-containing protein n=1 Tax=Kineococcus sp. SYSU DK011 TaxID=3383132 RepID=UPI003D7D05E0
MLRRVLALLRSPWVRGGFLLLALALAVAYLVRERTAIADAWARLDAAAVLTAFALSLANVALSGASWRAVLADLGSPLPWRGAARVFFVGQLGRYVPGTVFQFVAQAELARDLGVPRRRTGSALAVALLVSMTTAGLLATGVLPLALHGAVPAGSAWAGRVRWLAPLLLVLLVPAVLNRLLGALLRLARQEPLEHPVTARGLLAAAGWALASWLAVGLQVFVLAHALGSGWPAGRLLALAVGGYALAWVVGFLVVLAPAGAGARELALAAVVALALGGGGAAVVVLGSRVLLTAADLLLALSALATTDRAALARARRAAPADRHD